jgi:RNA polymerase primary sigma factor
MAILTIHQDIIDKIYNVYKTNGYVSEEYVLDVIIEHDISLDKVDLISEQLLSVGVLIQDESVMNSVEVIEDTYDRSRTDYESIFNEVVSIDESLIPLIDYIRKIKAPRQRESQNLLPQAKSGNTFAKERIIEMYLRVVIKIALWHHKKYRISLADTIQDGCIGLVVALEKYEFGRQDKFSTYAPWWVRQNIVRNAPTLNPLIYIPVHIKDKLFSIYHLLGKCYCNQNECYYNCSGLKEVVKEQLGCTIIEATEYINYLNPFESLEQLLEKDEAFFSDGNAIEEEILTEINNKELKTNVARIIKSLNSREERVILLRFGFIDGEEWTLEEVGKEFGVTRERIRQIEKKALGKLRSSKILKQQMK